MVDGHRAHRLPGSLIVVEASVNARAEDLAEVASAQAQRFFPRGECLMRQGEASDALFLIVRGSVRVTRTHRDLRAPVVLATVGPGAVVGEVGGHGHVRRSATLTAIDDTIAIAVDATTVAHMASRRQRRPAT